MAKYSVWYKSIEYYEKEYEADSPGAAEQMCWDDDKLWDRTPLDTELEITQIIEVRGNA